MDEEFYYPTESEIDRHCAYALGQSRPESAWVLSDRDAWYRNPYYTGPEVPHPEYEHDEEHVKVRPSLDNILDVPF